MPKQTFAPIPRQRRSAESVESQPTPQEAQAQAHHEAVTGHNDDVLREIDATLEEHDPEFVRAIGCIGIEAA